MVVLHDLIHSSSVHQDSCWWSSSIFLLESRSVINSSYSFEVEFCISSFFSAIQAFGCGIIPPQVLEMFAISTQQAYSFVVVVLTNSIQSFLLRMLSNSFMVEVVLLLSVLSFHYFNSSGGIVLFISSSVIHFVKFMFYSFNFQLECYPNSFVLTPSLPCSNRTGFIVYLTP